MQNTLTIHRPVLQRFAGLLKGGRLAHAYLLVGPAGVGKFETAMALAKLVNCEASAEGQADIFCGQCASCRKMETANHPDLHILNSGRGETIKIENIRELIGHTQLKSFEAQRKVFGIRNAENLTLEGANALLKTLEEPSAHSLLLLTTSVPEKNLATIRSRCQAIYFFPYANGKLADYLINDYHIEEPAAYFLASFTEGCLGRAQQLHQDNLLPRKNEIIDNVIFSPDSEAYFKKVLADKEQTKELLDVLLTWFRDLLLMKTGVEAERLTHQDRKKDLERSALLFSFEDIQELLAEIVRTMKLLNDNLNVKIALTLIKAAMKF